MWRNVRECQRARMAISLGLDGELSQLERAFLHAHTTRCEACETYRDDVVARTSLLRAQPLEQLGHDVTMFTPRTRRRSLRPGTSAAAAALVVVGLMAAAQFAIRPSTLSSLDASGSSVAASTEELNQIYEEA